MRESLPLRLVWRTEAIAALEKVRDGRGNEAELRAVAKQIHRQGGFDGDPVWAYAELIDALAMVVPWKQFIRDRNPAHHDCRPAASLRASDALAARRVGRWWPPALEVAAIALRDLTQPDDVVTCAEKLLAVPLPSRVTTATLPAFRLQNRQPSEKRQEWGPVSVSLALGAKPLPTLFGMKPLAIYDVRVEVRWPPSQVPPAHLRIRFESDFSERQAEFLAVGLAPNERTGRARFQLLGNLEPRGTRKDVHVVAELLLANGVWPISIIGHTRFEVMTHDPTHDRTPGQPWGAKFDEMLTVLDSRLPSLPEEDRGDFIRLFDAVCEFGQLVLNRRYFPDGTRVTERALQANLFEYLSRIVGSDLQEGSRMAGGELDLMFRSIVLELKVEHEREVKPTNVAAWHRQPVFYSTARGCPVSILCVLDQSPKSDPPGVLANYMTWSEPRLHGLGSPDTPALVAVVVIPIGFGAPHDGGKSKPIKKPSKPRKSSRGHDA